MQEEIVNFQTAKLAKEKGFIKFTNPRYASRDIEGCSVKIGDLTTLAGADIPAPTQSLLQKWLREVHNIKLWNEFGYTNEWFCYYLNKYDDKIQLTTNLRNATYEEALEVGLQECLKLIK